MDLEHWQRLRQLSEQYAALPAPEADAWLAEIEPDPKLRQQVRELVERTGTAGPALPMPAASELLANAKPGQRVGPWRLLEELGEGGMGSVWLAERAEGGFNQTAALKFIRFGLVNADSVRRFEVERQVLARLRHSGIATLLDGGCTEQGQPWLALEHIGGEDILSWCDRHRLNVAARIRLFLQVSSQRTSQGYPTPATVGPASTSTDA